MFASSRRLSERGSSRAGAPDLAHRPIALIRVALPARTGTVRATGRSRAHSSRGARVAPERRSSGGDRSRHGAPHHGSPVALRAPGRGRARAADARTSSGRRPAAGSREARHRRWLLRRATGAGRLRRSRRDLLGARPRCRSRRRRRARRDGARVRARRHDGCGLAESSRLAERSRLHARELSWRDVDGVPGRRGGDRDDGDLLPACRRRGPCSRTRRGSRTTCSASIHPAISRSR